MPFLMVLDIGTPESPDLINIKGIKRAKKIKGTDTWKVFSSIDPLDVTLGVTITDEQYSAMMEMLIRKEDRHERREEPQTIRISLDPEARG